MCGAYGRAQPHSEESKETEGGQGNGVCAGQFLCQLKLESFKRREPQLRKNVSNDPAVRHFFLIRNLWGVTAH